MRSALRLLACLTLAATAPAWAACSRLIVMPMAQAVVGPLPPGGQADGELARRVRAAGAPLGCEFSFPLMPRPRLQAMLLDGTADVMMPAAREEQRDAAGLFLPMSRVQPELLMRRDDARRPPSLQALVADASLRGLMVRGQSWGGAVEQALQGEAATRLQRVGDMLMVIRMLAAERADFVLVMPELFHGLARQPELREAVARLELRPLTGVPAVEAGAYVSRALPPGDQALLQRILTSEPVRQLMQRPPPR